MARTPADIWRAIRAAAVPTQSDPDAMYEAPDAKSNVPDRELGAAGTVNYRGYLQQAEYNPDWRGTNGVQTADEMWRSDAAVQEAFFHIEKPILNATWLIEPASDDPEDREVAEFVRRAYFEWLCDPFIEYLQQILRYLRYGHALFEHTWQVVEAPLSFDDPDHSGQKIDVDPKQFLTFKRFAPRLPYTIWKWHATDGELTSVVQRVWKDLPGGTQGYVNIEIPAEQLLLYVNEREGDDWTGTSILRAAYKAYYLKTLAEKVLGIAIERGGVGIPIVYLPDEFRDDEAMVARWESILGNLRAGEQNYIVVPGPSQQHTANGQGFLVDILSPSQGQAIHDTVEFLQYCRAEIKGAVLARFSELGHGSTGARATGEVQSEIWYDALHAIAEYIGEVNATAIKRLVDANYPGVTDYPKLVARDIEARNLEQFAVGIANLVSSGAINPDKSFREFVRSGIDAPDEDEIDDEGGDDEGGTVTPPADKDGPGGGNPRPQP